MNALVIYESLTGHTRQAAELIVEEFGRRGNHASSCSITAIDHQALSDADLVVVGTWTDGFVWFGQRPGRAGRLRSLPALDRKRCAVYCTYAVNPGHTLGKMEAILAGRGANVVGGLAIRRNDLRGGAATLVERVLAATPD